MKQTLLAVLAGPAVMVQGTTAAPELGEATCTGGKMQCYTPRQFVIENREDPATYPDCVGTETTMPGTTTEALLFELDLGKAECGMSWTLVGPAGAEDEVLETLQTRPEHALLLDGFSEGVLCECTTNRNKESEVKQEAAEVDSVAEETQDAEGEFTADLRTYVDGTYADPPVDVGAAIPDNDNQYYFKVTTNTPADVQHCWISPVAAPGVGEAAPGEVQVINDYCEDDTYIPVTKPGHDEANRLKFQTQEFKFRTQDDLFVRCDVRRCPPEGCPGCTTRRLRGLTAAEEELDSVQVSTVSKARPNARLEMAWSGAEKLEQQLAASAAAKSQVEAQTGVPAGVLAAGMLAVGVVAGVVGRHLFGRTAAME